MKLIGKKTPKVCGINKEKQMGQCSAPLQCRPGQGDWWISQEREKKSVMEHPGKAGGDGMPDSSSWKTKLSTASALERCWS